MLDLRLGHRLVLRYARGRGRGLAHASDPTRLGPVAPIS